MPLRGTWPKAGCAPRRTIIPSVLAVLPVATHLSCPGAVELPSRLPRLESFASLARELPVSAYSVRSIRYALTFAPSTVLFAQTLSGVNVTA